MILFKSKAKYFVLFFGLIAFTFSGLNWHVWFAAWIAPVLMLYFARNSKWTEYLILFVGIGFGSAISKSAENLSGIFLIYITTGVSYGLLHTLPFVLDKLLVRRGTSFYSTLVFPAAVVFTEFALSLGIGIWGNSAIAQYPNTYFIQITSLFGVFGISFMVAWLASVLNWVVNNGLNTRRIRSGLVIYGLVFIAVILFGFIRTNISSAEKDTVKVAAVVGETDIHQVFENWEEEIIGLSKNYDAEIPVELFSDSLALKSIIRRTEEALSNGANVVVWNEISLFLRSSQLDSLVTQIREICMRDKAFVLIAALVKDGSGLPKPFNNQSILVKPNGEIAWEYLKCFLNPLEAMVINKGDGPIPYIDTEYGRIANAICADLDLSGYISQIGKESVDILLVPAFDWEEITPYHSHMAAFAAIQYGVSIIRANGKGIVAFYDYRGELLKQNNTFTSDSKINYVELPLGSTTTLYSVIGNLFVYLLMLFLLIMTGLRIVNH